MAGTNSGFYAGDDDLDPRVDNPDVLPTDPTLEVVKFERNPNPIGDGFSIDLPAGVTVSGVPMPGIAFQVLALDPARAVAHLIAVGGPVMISNDPSSMINGRGAIIPQGVVIPITTSAEVHACIPAAASPTAATISVWFEQTV